MKIDISKINSEALKIGMELANSLQLGMDFKKRDLAYVVGGCVRDLVRAELGQTEYTEIHDVDIATNRPMDDIIRNFRTESNNGEAHGTLLVFRKGIPFEVTQFRTDGEYTDGRHPDSVKFAKTFEEDVARRDFTINAIGMDGDGNLIDPTNGIKDIQNGVIRAVGNPVERFKEDALRILRGIRFSINFNYVIDADTICGMLKTVSGLANISGERVRGEILKLNKQNGGFVRFLRIVKQIGAEKYLECFKDVLFDDLLKDADKIKDFTDENVFPIILNNAIDYRATAKRLACTRDDIICIAVTVALLSSCDRYQPEELLLPKSDISLTIKGEDQIRYDQKTWQLGHNAEKNEFRAVNDKLTDWMILRCNATPSTVGQSVTAYLEYTTSNDTKKLNALTFTVEKTSTEGLIWLWNDDKKIGVVVKDLSDKL